MDLCTNIFYKSTLIALVAATHEVSHLLNHDRWWGYKGRYFILFLFGLAFIAVSVGNPFLILVMLLLMWGLFFSALCKEKKACRRTKEELLKWNLLNSTESEAADKILKEIRRTHMMYYFYLL